MESSLENKQASFVSVIALLLTIGLGIMILFLCGGEPSVESFGQESREMMLKDYIVVLIPMITTVLYFTSLLSEKATKILVNILSAIQILVSIIYIYWIFTAIFIVHSF